MDRTTIQLQEATKDDLDTLKRVDGESYDSIVKMLIANYNNSQEGRDMDESRVRELAREEVTDMVVLEALEWWTARIVLKTWLKTWDRSDE